MKNLSQSLTLSHLHSRGEDEFESNPKSENKEDNIASIVVLNMMDQRIMNRMMRRIDQRMKKKSHLRLY